MEVKDGETPSLHKGKPTLLFIEMQAMEKHGINPLHYFAGEDASWKSKEGRAIKALLIAYHQLIAEEERRIMEERENMLKENEKKNKQSNKQYRKRGLSSIHY